MLALILKDKNVSALKLAKELEVSLATIKRDLSALSAENKIEHIGGNRYGHWIVKKD
nr:HTH domain-containing protein [Psittacicella melopsittaci]